MPLYRMRDAASETSRGVVVALMVGVAVLIVALLLTMMAVFGFGFFSQKSANFRGETQKRNQVEGNGSYRIAAYDHFFNLCAGVQTSEASIRNLEDELKTHPSEQRKAVIVASITALKNKRAEDINQYNVDADKSYTAGQFRDSNLPYKLDMNDEETQCTA